MESPKLYPLWIASLLIKSLLTVGNTEITTRYGPSTTGHQTDGRTR